MTDIVGSFFVQDSFRTINPSTGSVRCPAFARPGEQANGSAGANSGSGRRAE
ncbi:MAG: hypothetical protein ABSC61_09220 [Anaerolineales bacterium]